MGYRSDVAIKCGDKAFKMFAEAIKEYEWQPDKIIEYGEDGQYEYLMMWEWIKWYDSYDFVAKCNDIMNELDEAVERSYGSEYDSGYGYKFLRIGEDMSDNEERCNDWDIDIYISRVIDIGDPEDGRDITI